MLFDLGIRPVEAAQMLDLRLPTSFRYFQQWKRLPLLFTVRYKLARAMFRNLATDNRRVIARVLAAELGTSEEGVLAQMRKPWSIKQIVTGEWRAWLVRRPDLGHKARLIAWLQIWLSPRKSSEVIHILRIAFDQNLGPLEG